MPQIFLAGLIAFTLSFPAFAWEDSDGAEYEPPNCWSSFRLAEKGTFLLKFRRPADFGQVKSVLTELQDNNHFSRARLIAGGESDDHWWIIARAQKPEDLQVQPEALSKAVHADLSKYLDSINGLLMYCIWENQPL
jgi:hypothetical protein